MPATTPRLVSVIGLGMMGTALAEALLTAGHQVTVWNRSKEKTEPLAAKGAEPATSVEAAIDASDVTIVCVANHAATMEVLAGAASAPRSGKHLIVLTTMSSDESGEAAAWAAEQDMEYLDGTIFGLPSNITDHTAMIVYSGQRTVFNANLDILDALAESRHLSDEIGASVSFDRVFYIYAYAIAHAYLVSAAMAHAKGFSVDVLTDVAIARSGVITSRLKEMNSAIRSRDHHVTQCSMNIWADGFRASVTTCRDLGIDDALPSAIMGHFDKAIAAGNGDKEMSAIFETLVEGTGR